MKKKSRMYYRRKADKLWSQLIMSKRHCEVCGNKGTNPHHIIGRKNLTLRHDPRNGILLCFTHHTGGNLSAHNDPMWLMKWLVENRISDYGDVMFLKKKLSTQVDYQERIKSLEEHLKTYGEEGK